MQVRKGRLAGQLDEIRVVFPVGSFEPFERSLALQRKFGDHYLYAGLGTTLDLGANPRAASDRRATGVLDEGDLRTYRTLLARSDDVSDGGQEIVHLAQAN